MSEVRLGRYAGPFANIPFKHYIQSPIGLVPKDKGKKTRLIFHLSYPRYTNKSVNVNTPKEKCTVKYPDFDQAIKLCLTCGKHCKIGKSDLISAFRHAPIHKDDWYLLVMKARSPFDGKWYYFIDKCLPFGHTLSCALFQKISNAIAHLVSHRTGEPNLNYLDDFFFVAILAYMCNSHIETFLQVCKEINFPVSLDKTFWATDRLVFLGLLIDTTMQRVCIPLEKLTQLKLMINSLLNKRSKKATLYELQSVCGHLNFICKCVIPGRAFTRRLYAATAGLKRPTHHTHITKQLRLDLEMWLKFLEYPDIFSRPFLDFTTSITATEISFFTDASRNPNLGMGGICGTSWMIKRWDYRFMIQEQPSIAYLELFALTACLIAWLDRFRNQRIIVFCDNMSVVHMVNKNTSNCPQCLKLIRLLVLESMIKNVRVYARHVPTKQNFMADYLSRMKLASFLRRSKGKFEKEPDSMPDCLWPMSKIWFSS